MELFPAQPDLSLQISPPSTTQPNNHQSLWLRRRSNIDEDHEDGEDQEKQKELDLRVSSPILSKQRTNNPDLLDAPFNLSLSNSSFRVSSFSPKSTTSSTNFTAFPHYQLLQTYSLPNPNYLHSHEAMTSQSQEEQHGYMNMKPIKGIPIYQNLTNRYPFKGSMSLDSFSSLSNSNPNINKCNNINNGSMINPSSCFQPSYQTHHGFMRSRLLSRFPGKKSMRAPRMRWTSTLHARFVHAVELLGGHESN